MRRVWAGLLMAAWVGAAAAQPPDVVLLQKTAGQPDRKLKLVKLLDGAEGERFAEVLDIASGARYQLPMAALAGMSRVAADPAPAAKPAPSTGKFPTSLQLPTPTAGGHSPFTSRQMPKAAPTPKTRPQPPAGLDTPITAMVGGPPAVAPGEALTLPVPTRAVTPSPDEPPPSQPTSVAGVMARRFEAATPVLTQAVAAEPAVVPQSMPAAPPELPPVQSVAFPTPAATWQPPPADPMRAETDPYTHDLLHALRPTVRERAATALANCRHASHPEVKRLLAQVAAADPAPAVQAHCVRILAALGYHARDHVEFLEVSLGSDHPGLRQAAAAALAKLAPR